MVYLCIKDLVMDDNGEVSAIRGRAYEFKKTGKGLDYFIDEQSSTHNMDKDGMSEYFGVAVEPKGNTFLDWWLCKRERLAEMDWDKVAEAAWDEARKIKSEIRCSVCLSLLKSSEDNNGGIDVQPCQKCAERAAAEKVESGQVFRWLKEGVDVICPGDMQVYNGCIVPATEDFHDTYNSSDHWPTFRPVDIGQSVAKIVLAVASIKKIVTDMQM